MLEVDRYTLETSREKFFAGGDLVTGASNVSNAMGYGKDAARNIDARLSGRVAVRRDHAEVRLRPAPPDPDPGRRHQARDLPAAVRAQDLRRGDAEPRARGSRARKPPAACAATSAKPAATPSSIAREKPSCLLKSPCESTANSAPPPRARPSSRWRRANGQVHPLALPPGGAELARLLPPVPGRGRRASAACCPPAPRRPSSGMSVTTDSETPDRHHRLMALELLVRRAQPLLRRLRVQRPLRAAGPGRRRSASPTSATPTTTRACRSTSRIRAMCSTTTAASCAPAACGSATRSRARMSGTSAARGITSHAGRRA